MMNLEWNWNEWQYENSWKPCARVGAAMLSSVLLLMSVQEPLQMPTAASALTKTDFGVSALQKDTGSSAILKKAQKIVCEEQMLVTEFLPEKEIDSATYEEQPVGGVYVEAIPMQTNRIADLSIDEKNEETVHEIRNIEKTEEISDITAIPDTTVAADTTVIPDATVIPDTTVIPAEEAEEEAANMAADNGYLINDSGMIYGISGTKDLVEDGILILPSEDCTGIAAGALNTLGAEVEEIKIPANLTEIEPGAFTGLSELGWIETDPANAAYFSIDGVLYTADGTELLVFPAAWTGTFQVPADVTRFAEYAFEGTNLTCIDARACALEETGNLTGSVELLQ